MTFKNVIPAALFAGMVHLCAHCAVAQTQTAPAIQWEKSLGGTDGDHAFSIQQTSDSGYIVAGLSRSNDSDVSGNHGGNDVWVVKLDSLGSIVWQKSYGGTKDDAAWSIRQTSDGGYILAGYTASQNGDVTGNPCSSTVYWIVKVDPSGTIQWQNAITSCNYERAYSVRQATDGGYIVTGSGGTNLGNGTDHYVIKLNSSGVVQWKKSLGGTWNDDGFSISQTSDGGYIEAGNNLSENDGDVTGHHGTGVWNYKDFWVVRLDATGTIKWEKSLGGLLDDEARSVQQTSDGGFIVAGYAMSTDGDVTGNHGGTYYGDYWIVKLDANGVTKWEKSFGGTGDDAAYSIQQTSDAGYIVAGSTNSVDGDVTGNHGGDDYWVVKLDSTGVLQWEKCLGGTAQEEAQSVQQTYDGGFIIAGSSNSTDGDVTGNHGNGDFWIVKLGPPIVAPVIFSAGSLNFTLVCDSVLTDTIWVHNTGAKDLQLTAASLLGTDAPEYVLTQPTAFPITIVPGDSTRFIIRLSRSAVGQSIDTLAITNNDLIAGHNPWNILLKARKDHVAFSVPRTINSVSHSGAVTGPIAVFRNTGTVPDTITTITRDSGVAWITYQFPATPITVLATSPNDTALLHFRIAGAHDTGWFAARFKVRVQPCGVDGFVTVRVYLKSGIDSVAATVSMDSLLCESETCRTYTVINTGNDTLKIDSLRIRGTDATHFGPVTPATPRKLAAKDSFAFTVCFIPNSTGSRSATLRVYSDDSVKPNPAITAVAARKDSAELSLSQTAVLLGDVCVNTKSCLTFSARNVGTVPDTITSIVLASGSGAFTISTPIPPATVVVGTAQDITVCFAPPDKGNYTATFVVNSQPCGRSHAFTVVGRGVTVNISPVATQVDYGDVRVGNCVDTVVGFVVGGNGTLDVSDVTADQLSTILSVIAFTPTLPHRFLGGDTLWATIHYCPVCNVSLSAHLDVVATTTALCPVSAGMSVIGRGNCSSLALGRRAIVFNSPPCGSVDSLETLALSNVGTLNLDVACVFSGTNASDFAVDLPSAFTLVPNGSRQLIIRFTARTIGVHTAQLIVTSNDPTHPADTLTVTARIDSAALTIVPQSIDYGDLPSCLVPMDTTIVLWNGGTVVDTVNASLGNNFRIISAMPRLVGPGKFDTVAIRFDPVTFDRNISEDLIFTSMPCALTDTVHLRGRADTYSFVPDTIDFGNTQVGDTVCLAVSIVNRNAQSVRITNIVVAPLVEVIAESPVLPVTIAAHDSIVVAVCYAPLDSTPMRAELRARVDLPCADTIIGALIGHGIRSDLTVSPRPLDFGTIDVCTPKLDSVHVCNLGGAPISIAALPIGGPDAATFALVNPPVLPFTLAPGECQWIVVRCDTGQRGEGTWRAILTITPQDPTLPAQTVNLYVVRRAPVLAVPAVVDFGKVPLGTSIDTTIVLHNTGILALCIDALNSATEFTITTKPLPLTLLPGDSLVLNIRFTPAADSSYGIVVAAHFTCPCAGVKQISLFGAGETNTLCTATAALVLDTIEARVGNQIDIPIRLLAQSNIATCGASDFTYTLRYHRSLLVPIPKQGRDSAEWHIIGPITGTRNDTTGAIGTLNFIVTLGDTDTTPLIMQSFAWTNGSVATTITNGQLHIANICPAGGKRLVDAEGTFTLAQNAPNPFTGETTFEFETIEQSRTRLVIQDVLGRTVAVVIDDELIPGRYRKTINTHGFPSGVYRALLESAAMRAGVTIVKSR